MQVGPVGDIDQLRDREGELVAPAGVHGGQVRLATQGTEVGATLELVCGVGGGCCWHESMTSAGTDSFGPAIQQIPAEIANLPGASEPSGSQCGLRRSERQDWLSIQDSRS